ncbi:MAG: hypothetical protein WAM53_01370, partial [Terrimicrobiaceae bacterium]
MNLATSGNTASADLSAMLHNQRIALKRHRRLAETRIDEIVSERQERRKRPRIGRLGKQFGLRFEAGLRLLEIVRHVVAFRVAENPVQYPHPERDRRLHMKDRLACESDADALL